MVRSCSFEDPDAAGRSRPPHLDAQTASQATVKQGFANMSLNVAGRPLTPHRVLNAAETNRRLLLAHGTDDLGVGGEAACRRLGVGDTIVNADLKHTAAGAQQ